MVLTAVVLEEDKNKSDYLAKMTVSALRDAFFEPRVSSFISLVELEDHMINKKMRSAILILPADHDTYMFAKRFRNIDRECAIFFMGQSFDYIIEAFHTSPLCYFLMSNTASAFCAEIKRVAQYVTDGGSFFSYEGKNKVLRMNLAVIDYFESNYHLANVVKSDRTRETIIAKLNDIQSNIAGITDGFCRCHQSYLVNLNNIESIDKTYKKIIFNSGQEAFASKSSFGYLLESFKKVRGGGEI